MCKTSILLLRGVEKTLKGPLATRSLAGQLFSQRAKGHSFYRCGDVACIAHFLLLRTVFNSQIQRGQPGGRVTQSSLLGEGTRQHNAVFHSFRV